MDSVVLVARNVRNNTELGVDVDSVYILIFIDPLDCACYGPVGSLELVCGLRDVVNDLTFLNCPRS